MTVPTTTGPPSQTRPPDDPPIIRDNLAEQILIGAALLTGQAIDDARAEGLTTADFWRPAHQTLWNTITRLYDAAGTTEPVQVLDALRTAGELLRTGGAPYLHDCIAQVPTVANAAWSARHVHDLARQRTIQETGRRLTQIATNPATDRTDLEDLLAAAAHTILEVLDDDRQGITRRHVPNVDEFLAVPEDEYDWAIPGMLERQDRLMLTGPEGGGKSTFCRQLAVMAAAGIHPFTGERFPPIRVLYVDLENSERQSRRKIRPLRHQAGQLLDPDLLRIEVRARGIDLLQAADQQWLLDLVADAKPDLLITGPIYRMASGDPTEEKTAKPVSQTLDRIRDTNTALLIEAHVAKASNGSKRRPREPYGASLWLRWPEFGVYLDRDGTIEDWRGQRDEREWPAMLTRGGQWPWTPSNDPAALLWARICQARDQFGEPMSVRDLEGALGHPKSTIHRCLKAHEVQWQALNGGTEE